MKDFSIFSLICDFYDKVDIVGNKQNVFPSKVLLTKNDIFLLFSVVNNSYYLIWNHYSI